MTEEGPTRKQLPRVLFVDDEPLVVRSLKRTLASRTLDWEPRFAESGEAALSVVDAEVVDVVVSDMHMPGMDGAELLRRVQERRPEVVRIVLSGQSDPKLVFRAVPVAHQFLTKPFDSNHLVAAIQRALELRRLIADPDLRKVIGGDNRLPAAPRTYTALTSVLAREDASVGEIVEVVERDPALAARVAQLGSSSFFRVPPGVRGLSGIVAYLGVDLIKTLVLTVEITRVFTPNAAARGFSVETFQSHSVGVGHLTRRMLERTEQTEDAFLAGVLHDVGRLVLASRSPAAYAAVLDARSSGKSKLVDAERAVLGVTHAEVGAYLLGIWGLPLDIVDAVRRHHDQAPPPRELTLGRAVYLANLLANDPEAVIDEAEVRPSGSQPPARISHLRALARELVCAK
ncbi:MAG TPA: response regulator [Polyangiaceae bacterium]|nr:response regulator [Polyangiaceae bacterium]